LLGDGNVRLPHPSNIGWLTHGGVASGAIKVRIHKVVSHRVTKVALQAPSLESSWVLGRGGLTPPPFYPRSNPLLPPTQHPPITLIKAIMEALVYTFLLVGTLGVIFFAIFFREPPRVN